MIKKIKLIFNLILFFYSRVGKLRKFQIKLLSFFAIFSSLFEVATLFFLYPPKSLKELFKKVFYYVNQTKLIKDV